MCDRKVVKAIIQALDEESQRCDDMYAETLWASGIQAAALVEMYRNGVYKAKEIVHQVAYEKQIAHI